jgi:hypothetical protein
MFFVVFVFVFVFILLQLFSPSDLFRVGFHGLQLEEFADHGVLASHQS